MSEKKSFIKTLISNIKYTLANKIAARGEENNIKKHQRNKTLKALFDKEERKNRKKNKVKAPLSDRIFNGANAVLMVLLVIVVVFPLLYLIANAFSDGAAKHEVILLPKILLN